MNQSSHTGQKMKNRRMLLLLWFYSEKTSFSHLAHPISLLPLDHLGFFYSIVFFLFCTCAEPNKCDVMQSRAVRIEPGKSKRRAWKSKEYIRECKCWPHDNLRCLIFFCISFQLYSESTSLPVLNIVLWLKLYSFYEQVSKSDVTREPQTAHLVSLVNGN